MHVLGLYGTFLFMAKLSKAKRRSDYNTFDSNFVVPFPSPTPKTKYT